MQQAHWEHIFKHVDAPLEECTKLTLSLIRDKGVLEEKELISETVGQAVGENQLETGVECVAFRVGACDPPASPDISKVSPAMAKLALHLIYTTRSLYILRSDAVRALFRSLLTQFCVCLGPDAYIN